MNPIEYYTYLFPQLTLEPVSGLSKTDAYRDIVLRGNLPDDLTFPLNTTGEAEIISLDTPIGKTEVLYLPDRAVFERFITCLANRCEPTDIPKTTGAIYISGLNCWRKIYAHQEEYCKDHDDWDEEFDRFTANKENYQSKVLLVSKGYYSALEPSFVGFKKDEWLSLSKTIRIYHETTHAISRKLYPEHASAVRDEVIADSIGLYAACGFIDSTLLLKFLGCENEEYREGGRLQNYVSVEELPSACLYVKELLNKILFYIKEKAPMEPFELLLNIEKDYIR